MKLLLDTHTLLCCFSNPSELSKESAKAISDGNNTIYVSPVSTWEIVIKANLGKLKIPDNIEREIEKHYFNTLPIKIAHTLELSNLPSIHNDPFDRLLISQAIVEDLTFVTRDKLNIQYPVSWLKA